MKAAESFGAARGEALSLGAGNPGASGARRRRQLRERRGHRRRGAPLGQRCGGPGYRLKGRQYRTLKCGCVCPSFPQAKHPPDALSGGGQASGSKLFPTPPPKTNSREGRGGRRRGRGAVPQESSVLWLIRGWERHTPSASWEPGACPRNASVGRPKGDDIKGVA